MSARAYRSLLKCTDLKNPEILEIGSGSGVNSLLLSRILAAKQVVLVDSNDVSLGISKEVFQNSGVNVKFLSADALKVDPGQEFDIVHSEGLIEHFYGQERVSVFRKHVDFCKRNGFVIIFVPCKSLRYTLFMKACQLMGKWIYEEQEFSKEELCKLCGQFDLRILKWTWLVHQIGFVAKYEPKEAR